MTQTALLRTEDTALVVIDVQEKLLPHIADGDRVVDRLVRLAKAARILGLPVVWAEQEKLGPTVSPVRDALPGLDPVVKAAFGCFGCKALAGRIASSGRGTLLLAGIEAHICVAQTALQALGAGYRVQVVADAVGSRDPANRAVALERVHRAGAVVTTFEMAVYELLGRAGTDAFRQILPLVK